MREQDRRDIMNWFYTISTKIPTAFVGVNKHMTDSLYLYDDEKKTRRAIYSFHILPRKNTERALCSSNLYYIRAMKRFRPYESSRICKAEELIRAEDIPKEMRKAILFNIDLFQ